MVRVASNLVWLLTWMAPVPLVRHNVPWGELREQRRKKAPLTAS